MNIDQTTLMLFGTFPRGVGVPSRSVVRNLGEFENFILYNNGVRDCYADVYPHSGIVDKIPFDLDGFRYGMEEALPDARKLYSSLLEQRFSVIPILSGKKGFHFYVLLRPKRYEEEEMPLLLNAFYSIVSSVFGKVTTTMVTVDGGDHLAFVNKYDIVTVDPSSIRRKKLMRIPNTLRPPENLSYCTYLPPDWVSMTLEELIVHSKSPHSYSYEIGELGTLHDFEKADFELKTFSTVVGDSSIQVGTPNEFLRNVLRPLLYEQIIKSHPPHHVRVAATADLLQFFTPKEILDVYRQIGWVDFDPEKTQRQIESCKGLKPYSNKTLRRYGVR